MRILLWAFLGAALGALLAFAGALRPLDRALYDAHFSLRGAGPAPTTVRLVLATDDDALEAGVWPWPRARHAEAVRRATAERAGPIGIDYLFDSASNPEDDAALARALADAGNVVLARTLDAPPLQPFAEAAVAMGHIDVPLDPDGTVRRIPLVARRGGELRISFALALAMARLGVPREAVRIEGDEVVLGSSRRIPVDSEGRMLVDFVAGPGGFGERSYRGLREQPSDSRTLLVGNAMTGVSDSRPAPIAPALPGIYVHANAVANILENRFLREAGPLPGLLLGLFGALAAGLLLPRLPAIARAPFALPLVALPLGLGHLLFRDGLVVAAAGPALSTALACAAVALAVQVGEARRRRRVDRVFARFLPPAVHAQVLSDPDRFLAGTKRVEISVLMARLRGFETANLSPEEEARLLREFLAAVGPLVHAERGTIARLSGGSVFVFYNDPLPVPDHAAAACRTALALRDAARRLNAGWVERVGAPLELSAAVHLGYATVGPLGSLYHEEYTAVGATVTEAEGLLDRARGGRLLVSGRVHALVSDRFVSALVEEDERLQGVYELERALA